VLEQLHLPRQRGLRNVQALGSAAEAAFLKGSLKRTELFEHNAMVIRNLNHGNRQPALSACAHRY
jgi:hypothetical protein